MVNAGTASNRCSCWTASRQSDAEPVEVCTRVSNEVMVWPGVVQVGLVTIVIIMNKISVGVML